MSYPPTLRNRIIDLFARFSAPRTSSLRRTRGACRGRSRRRRSTAFDGGRPLADAWIRFTAVRVRRMTKASSSPPRSQRRSTTSTETPALSHSCSTYIRGPSGKASVPGTSPQRASICPGYPHDGVHRCGGRKGRKEEDRLDSSKPRCGHEYHAASRVTFEHEAIYPRNLELRRPSLALTGTPLAGPHLLHLLRRIYDEMEIALGFWSVGARSMAKAVVDDGRLRGSHPPCSPPSITHSIRLTSTPRFRRSLLLEIMARPHSRARFENAFAVRRRDHARTYRM